MFEYVENLRKVYNVCDGDEERRTSTVCATLSEFYSQLPGLIKFTHDNVPVIVMAFDKKNNEIACYYILSPRPKDLILFAVINYETAITNHSYEVSKKHCTNGAKRYKNN